jgi:uncharacterized protein YbcC (UPF0753/DUF2309 family)
MASIAAAVQALGLTASQRRTWLAALLGNVRGWSAFCAYERWQARLAGQDDDQIVHLLAMRAAWEWLLVEDMDLQSGLTTWRARLDRHGDEVVRVRRDQQTDWLLQNAMEIAFQQPLCRGLRNSASLRTATAAAAQAVFCIDVRSERFRRALEAASGHAVQTRGFAGFFGLPVAYAPLGTDQARPQLPGLLAPQRTTTQVATVPSVTGQVAARRRAALDSHQHWARFRSGASSAFTFVESCGLLAAASLVQNSRGAALPPRAEDAGLRAAEVARLRPSWGSGDSAPGVADRVAMAAATLRAMGLQRDFARLVLLAGHGSTSANNPHAKGLDCGACGGQTGEVNARLLAELLNDGAVRAGLARQGIAIPETTWFVPGLHDTTTDDLHLFDLDTLPAGHAADLQQLQRWLAAAGDQTRVERAPSLGLAGIRHDASVLAAAMRRRAADWSQLRPEWGLADNAAFVIAPRARTRHLDLGGRVFLHDYDWRSDEGFATLTLILTAPMVVTNWINLQYYASTVDNRRFGSGNKVLHNVVGGSIGVFEGNGGDLRIGLPMQSLHDGNEWRHTPLRLSVFVEAPTAAIDSVIAGHSVVQHLVEHGWLFLFRIGEDGATWQRRPDGSWHPTR